MKIKLYKRANCTSLALWIKELGLIANIEKLLLVFERKVLKIIFGYVERMSESAKPIEKRRHKTGRSTKLLTKNHKTSKNFVSWNLLKFQ